jgi:hypothetical protein
MTDVTGMSEKAIIEAFVKLEKAAQQIGRKITEDTIKYMEVMSNSTGGTSQSIIINLLRNLNIWGL